MLTASADEHPGVHRSSFKAPWWLKNCHAQTLWASSIRKPLAPEFRFERIPTADGDEVELAWSGSGTDAITLILHGLEGSCYSNYVQGLARTLTERGMQCCILQFRGCGSRPNRYPRNYHSGDTGDIAHVARLLKRRFPEKPLFAVGYSLGGNALLKYLGTEQQNPIDSAVAVSVPFDLAVAATTLETGFSRLYQRHLVGSLKRKVQNKAARVRGVIDIGKLGSARTFYQFDDWITAPLHGFAGVDDYYALSSCGQYLKDIQAPCLILHACDDPFMKAEVIPAASALGERVRLEVSDNGGHVGFVTGSSPLSPRYWLEERIPRRLQSFL